MSKAPKLFKHLSCAPESLALAAPSITMAKLESLVEVLMAESKMASK
jgi:hypothetical protein